MRVGLIAAVLAAFVVAAPASAATGTYAGTVGGEGKFALDVKIKRGHVTKFTALRVVNVPTVCEQSGNQHADHTLKASIPIQSPSGLFAGDYVQPDWGNISTINGKVKHEKVNGRLDISYHYPAETDPPLPEEDCSTGPLKFHAVLGAPDGTLTPPAAKRAR